MSYRNFTRPPFATSSETTTADWLRWLQDEAVLHSAAPRPTNSCRLCGGAVGTTYWGDAFDRCTQCNRYGDFLDVLVPATYSLDDGLESMLHRYKDWNLYQWLRPALASLFYYFASEHLACIEDSFGRVEVAVTVPPNDPARRFDHLNEIVTGVQDFNLIEWSTDVIARNRTVDRPSRGEVKPGAYQVDRAAVQSASLLLFDDTWTSGASVVSCAAALKEAGASSVVALTLGRQINAQSDWQNNQELVPVIRTRGWTNDCVLCV